MAMTMTFTPTACAAKTEKDEKTGVETTVAAEYSGTVCLRVPNYEERLDLSDVLQTDDGDDGDGSKEAVAARVKRMGHTALLKAAFRKLPLYVVSIDIMRVSDGHRFGSLDDMQYESPLAGAITEMTMRLLGKHNVGNP